MSGLFFDDRNIYWQELDGIEHLQYFILDIDEPAKTLDILFKFAARQQIVLHRHKVLNKTFVIQGEHRLYHTDGRIKDIRAVGSYTVSPPSDEPHREGGGDEDAIVLFHIRGDAGTLYQILDDQLSPVAELSLQDFIALRLIQREKPSFGLEE